MTSIPALAILAWTSVEMHRPGARIAYLDPVRARRAAAPRTEGPPTGSDPGAWSWAEPRGARGAVVSERVMATLVGSAVVVLSVAAWRRA